MITIDPDYRPEAAGEHEAYSLMNQALSVSNCEVLDYPRLVENMQNIPRSYTFMVGGESSSRPKQNVRLRGYVLPDGTLELVAVAYDKDVSVLRRSGDPRETAFMDPELWQTTALLLFGMKGAK